MSDRRLLVIDTCGLGGSVALSSAAGVRQIELAPRMAASHGMRAVRALLDEAGFSLADLDAIAVLHGPGSFTGVRVGVAMAKGLSEASGVGLIPLSRLDVLRAMQPKAMFAVLNAGRGEFYLGSASEQELVTLEEMLSRVPAHVTVVVCEDRVADSLDAFMVVRVAEPTAKCGLGLAIEALEAGRLVTAEAVDALYLRRPDAERALEHRG
ncbi:tRNA (adenosine(37)-N6)-threonylcarbamoyltransferase complex dimerization subunit type 1 TsaB [Terriglobus albidus]|uniref:tRNA (adenosine(37)-N6)-threonylcarbamoyltransferase complex dimerization subunit type 1 TsaB n=1 Tax=Terriglobus albidus TaxID=1592106 RepID=UPI0021DFC564|nr:tRNA (adenosine(37)-N6)-threonylcarbamoyltransferase complex dimerization subunit type 1 TsaB [Terriglobus albidus]